MALHEPASHGDVLAPRRLHVELEQVVEHDARELLLGLEPRDHRGDVEADPRPREVIGLERRGVHGEDADGAPGGQHAVHERHQHEGRGEDGHRHRRRHLRLELGEEAAVGGDGAHAFSLEEPRAVDERRQQRALALPHHLVGRGAVHPVVANGKVERRRVAHLAGDAGELGVEHQDPDREAIEILAAANSHAR
jgi:hypothetical protein